MIIYYGSRLGRTALFSPKPGTPPRSSMTFSGCVSTKRPSLWLLLSGRLPFSFAEGRMLYLLGSFFCCSILFASTFNRIISVRSLFCFYFTLTFAPLSFDSTLNILTSAVWLRLRERLQNLPFLKVLCVFERVGPVLQDRFFCLNLA